MLKDAPHAVSRLCVLLFDVILMVIAWFNLLSMKELAEVPEEYQPKAKVLANAASPVQAPRTILRVGGIQAETPGLLQYLLCDYSPGDSVIVTEVSNDIVADRKIRLVSRYTSFDLGTMIVVGSIFFIFAMYILINHSSRNFAWVLQAVVICTALMVLYDRGSLKLYSPPFNGLRWFLFDVAAWVLPSLFLHFSFLYPKEKNGHSRSFLTFSYVVSLSGVVLSGWYLVQIFLFGAHIYDTHYLDLRARGSDVFLLAGLLATVANLEHSALAIQDPYDRKRIYWVLLGISFGPLVYVFLMLVPRTMLGYELVSHAVMQYSLLMAPLMFYLAIRKDPDRKTGQSS